MQIIDEDDSLESFPQTIIKRDESNKKKSKRKLVESREDLKPGPISVSNDTLDTFLEARKHLKTVRDKSTTHHIKINSDEEVWIFHCPKNIESEDLLGRKIVLPQPIQIIQSKRGNKEFECKLELTKQENHLTLICPTNGFPEAVSVKQAGMISIRDRINLPQRKENGNSELNSADKLFLYPTNLRIRHPLLGVNIDSDRVSIKAEKDDSTLTSPKKKKTSGNHSSDRIKIKQETEEIIASPVKKDKKQNKRSRESVEIKVEPTEDVVDRPSKKHKHKKARLDQDNEIVKVEKSTKHKKTSIKIEPDSCVE